MATPIQGIGPIPRPPHRVVLGVAVAALASAALLITRPSAAALWPPEPLFWGFLAILLFLAVASAVSGSLNPLIVTIGQDGRLSTSKFQFFVWTGVVVF